MSSPSRSAEPCDDAAPPTTTPQHSLLTLLTAKPTLPAPLRAHATRLTGALARFHSHYAPQYPDGRVDALLAALLTPVRHAALQNTYSSSSSSNRLSAESEQLPWFPTPAYTSSTPFPPPGRRGEHYLLDAGSLLPVVALSVERGMKVLDLCAAPGGKSVSISQLLQGSGELHVNEPDKARRGRLKAVLAEYLDGVRGVEVKVSGEDGTRFSGSGYDRVLVDAPCSSSRHVLQAANKAFRSGSEKGLEDLLTWTSKRPQKCAALQQALLKRALNAVKVGGRVVYATCSIDEVENDGVVKAVVAAAEWKGRAKVVRPKGEELWVGERTKTGWVCLPDRGEGWGPLFFAVVKRVA
ncbi:S-adenosyl-L-methionine-dependent methyltransferase [Sphaerosporella brunnea]|uniref:S-adenosyl-L-methionine-dependent methyltransferase n=1 Tax=Sphaerosporella brunnea TaxID=1250544 RepID=A0A5J5EII8_9PEZI|nr:S-adenosyl-L-methionine-dependent methyltransferase [Sphaerosporella brunnea]